MINIKHVFMCLLTIFISSFMKCLFRFFVDFFIGSFFLLLIYMNCLYTLDTSALSDMDIANIFPQPEVCICFLHCCPLILLVFSFRKSVSEVILITCLPYCCRWLEFLHFIFFSLTRTFMGKTHNAVFSFPSQDHCKPHEEGCPLSGAASPTVRTKPGTKELDQRLINEWTNGRYN